MKSQILFKYAVRWYTVAFIITIAIARSKAHTYHLESALYCTGPLISPDVQATSLSSCKHGCDIRSECFGFSWDGNGMGRKCYIMQESCSSGYYYVDGSSHEYRIRREIDGYKLHENVDCPYDYINTTLAVSRERCKLMCDTNDDCRAFSYAINPTLAPDPVFKCILKGKQCSNRTYSATTDLYYEKLELPGKLDGYVLKAGIACKNVTPASTSVITLANCKDLCDRDIKCAQMSYASDNDKCNIYRNVCILVIGMGTTYSYIKKAMPGYIVHESSNCHQAPGQTFTNLNLNSCRDACDRQSDCITFVYDVANFTCRLQNKTCIDAKSAAKYDLSYSKLHLPGYIMKSGLTCHGTNFTTYSRATLQDCVKLCSTNTTCRSFVYKDNLTCLVPTEAACPYNDLRASENSHFYMKFKFKSYYAYERKSCQNSDKRLKRVSNLTIFECKTSCEESHQCQSFNFYENFTCSLLTGCNTSDLRVTGVAGIPPSHHFEKIAIAGYFLKERAYCQSTSIPTQKSLYDCQRECGLRESNCLYFLFDGGNGYCLTGSEFDSPCHGDPSDIWNIYIKKEIAGYFIKQSTICTGMHFKKEPVTPSECREECDAKASCPGFTFTSGFSCMINTESCVSMYSNTTSDFYMKLDVENYYVIPNRKCMDKGENTTTASGSLQHCSTVLCDKNCKMFTYDADNATCTYGERKRCVNYDQFVLSPGHFHYEKLKMSKYNDGQLIAATCSGKTVSSVSPVTLRDCSLTCDSTAGCNVFTFTRDTLNCSFLETCQQSDDATNTYLYIRSKL